jgi:hypothetical protein
VCTGSLPLKHARIYILRGNNCRISYEYCYGVGNPYEAVNDVSFDISQNSKRKGDVMAVSDIWYWSTRLLISG